MAQPEQIKKRLAFIISRILGPIPLVCLLWLVTAVKSGIGLWRAIWVYPLIFLFSIAIPTTITTLLIVTKHVSSIEWKSVQERKRYLTPVMLSGLACLVILTKLLTNTTTFHLSLVTAVIVLTTITVYALFNFKISFHMVIASGVFAGVNLFFHQQFLWLYLLLLPIAWARFTLKLHTVSELGAGVIVANAIIILSVLLFGWPAAP